MTIFLAMFPSINIFGELLWGAPCWVTLTASSISLFFVCPSWFKYIWIIPNDLNSTRCTINLIKNNNIFDLQKLYKNIFYVILFILKMEYVNSETCWKSKIFFFLSNMNKLYLGTGCFRGFLLKKMIMDNFQVSEVDPDVADAIDFMVERVSLFSHQIKLCMCYSLCIFHCHKWRSCEKFGCEGIASKETQYKEQAQKFSKSLAYLGSFKITKFIIYMLLF